MNRKTAPFGTYRDYPKIRIYVRKTGEYVCSTTWCRTCKEAVERMSSMDGRPVNYYRANFV